MSIYWTVVLAVVLGAVLVFNSWLFGVRWKRRRGQTGDKDDFFFFV